MNCLSAKRFVLLYHKKKSSLEKDWIFVYYKIGPRKSWKKKTPLQTDYKNPILERWRGTCGVAIGFTVGDTNAPSI